MAQQLIWDGRRKKINELEDRSRLSSLQRKQNVYMLLEVKCQKAVKNINVKNINVKNIKNIKNINIGT